MVWCSETVDALVTRLISGCTCAATSRCFTATDALDDEEWMASLVGGDGRE